MSEAIVAAVIAAGASLACQLVISGTAAKRDGAERARRRQKLDDDIALLAKRVDEHNHYAALFARQTEALADLSADLRLLQKDVGYLKEGLFHAGSHG